MSDAGRNDPAGPPAGSERVQFATFAHFYPFYLREHRNQTCRRLHFFGSLGALFCLAKLLVTLDPMWVVGGLIWAYGLAWTGHYLFEKNRPATFKYPLFSLRGDCRMFIDMLTGKIPF